jgi:RNA polymerase subunit RPABC4/transcription elongation factor Spt4/uncharacterized membrane protein
LVREEKLACVGCGYVLGALETCRCPECGRVFTFNDWPEFAFVEEIATMVRLRGPVDCVGCGALVGTGTDGRCGYCARRVRRVEIPGVPPLPLWKRENAREFRAAMWGLSTLVVLGGLTAIAVFWLDGQRPPARSVGSVLLATRFGWWWSSVMLVLVGVLFVLFVLFPSNHESVEEQLPMQVLLKAPRRIRLAIVWLVWITVAVLVLGLAIGVFLI